MRKKLLFGAFLAMGMACLAGTVMVADALLSNQALSNEYNSGGICESGTRISVSDATCLSGGVNRDGNNYVGWAQNLCSSYGTMKVHIDIATFADQHFVLDTNTAVYTTSMMSRIRNVTCCRNESDLCYREQVEANSHGWITTISATGSDGVDVSTHQARYDFCQASPNDIYCTNNPSGDAFTAAPPPSTECDGAPCLVQDCYDNFADSPAAGSPSSCTGLTIWPPSWGRRSRPGAGFGKRLAAHW